MGSGAHTIFMNSKLSPPRFMCMPLVPGIWNFVRINIYPFKTVQMYIVFLFGGEGRGGEQSRKEMPYELNGRAHANSCQEMISFYQHIKYQKEFLIYLFTNICTCSRHEVHDTHPHTYMDICMNACKKTLCSALDNLICFLLDSTDQYTFLEK